MQETETHTPQVEVRGRVGGRHLTIQVDRGTDAWPHAMTVTRAELQAIVQAAYDQHGLVAQLWTAEAAK